MIGMKSFGEAEAKAFARAGSIAASNLGSGGLSAKANHTKTRKRKGIVADRINALNLAKGSSRFSLASL
jgi:hypothetical protein